MNIKKIGVLTSGGDAPGMNAAIRAVVRTCVYYDREVFGIYNGYEGMIKGDIRKFNVRSVSKILGKGGTILKSSRSDAFRTEEGRATAHQALTEKGIDALIVIGGDGTFSGAHQFSKEFNFPVIGIPGTIDNDLPHTDYTIGFDTATNTVTECIDKIRDTASSHNRLFFVEVMGRDSGYIALKSCISTGAIAVMLPERKLSIEELIAILRKGFANQKTSSLVVVAEGNPNGGAMEVANLVKARYPEYDTKYTILGHLQRGGDPSCFDRVLASQLGVAAVEGLIDGKSDYMVGTTNNKITYTALAQCVTISNPIDEELLRISKILSI